jgi:molybdate-binding protein/DNA-binding transcriptional regulator YhcF (GntR family)
MGKTPLYQLIGEAIRQQILEGRLKPGDPLPTIREMASRWGCTPGTVQQAYQELARQGLLVSRPGQGTRVGSGLPELASAADQAPLRQAVLTHQAEAFLLEVLRAGYTPAEIERAFHTALDRWRTVEHQQPAPTGRTLRFVGSHDPAISLIAAHCADFAAGYTVAVTFTGSLGGLIALAEGKADMAGSHLWDEASDTYNLPFVERLLPGQRVALLTLAHRRLGLIVAPGNPLQISGLADLARPGVRFVNRQRGAGTRVWLDAHLRRLGIQPEQVVGYGEEEPTHMEVARAVATGRADVGLGIEAASLGYRLGFVPLTRERYDLIIPEEAWALPAVQGLSSWLATPQARSLIAELGGYETDETGQVTWT